MKIDYFPDMNFQETIKYISENYENSAFIFDTFALTPDASSYYLYEIRRTGVGDIKIINNYLIFQKEILSFFKNLNVFVVEETLMEYDKGKVIIDGNDISKLRSRKINTIRNNYTNAFHNIIFVGINPTWISRVIDN